MAEESPRCTFGADDGESAGVGTEGTAGGGRGRAPRRLAARTRAAVASGPLASANFRLLTGGQFTSTIGDYCYAIALPWLVLSAHGGPALLGAVLACYGIPRVAGIPAGGFLADRFGARRVMLVADVARAVLAGLLVLIAARHVTALAVLGPVAALLGAGEGLFIPGSFSIMPLVLPGDQLMTANAVNSAAMQAGIVIGPVLGGTIVAAVGSAPAFAVDAGSFAASALTLALIRMNRSAVPADAEPGTGPRTATGTGPRTATGTGPRTATGTGCPAPEHPTAAPGIWRLLRTERLLQVLLIVVLAANFGSGGTFEVALPALAHARFGAPGYGALLACIGVGMVVGTLISAGAGRVRRPAIAAELSFLLTAAAIAALPFADGLAGAAAAAVVMGASNGFGNNVFITLVQRWAPDEVRGRVMSLLMLAALGTFPLTTAVTGVLVHTLGPAPFFPIAGAGLALAILGALTQPKLRDLGARPSATAPRGAPTVSETLVASAAPHSALAGARQPHSGDVTGTQ